MASATTPEDSDGPGVPDEPLDGAEFGDDLPEQLRIRRDKRERLAGLGMDPYPVRLPLTHTIGEVRSAHADLDVDVSTGVRVGVAGRIIFLRNTGKLCFATLRSGDGAQIQAMISLDRVGEEALDRWKDLVDIGDHVFVAGEVITSKRGELSVLADEWTMAAKALRPLPVAHKPLSEQSRVRQRYLDLIVRPDARAMVMTRAEAVSSLRSSLRSRGFVEVETPMLQTMHGGASARPFVTHSNAFDIELFLRIAPELFLKRAVVGGLERVFEINRNFRNEGADSTHSPEFAMLEFYQAYADYRDMGALTQALIQEAALAVTESHQVTHADGSVHDLGGDWPWVSLYASVSDAVGREVSPGAPREEVAALCAQHGIEVPPTWVAGKCVEELFEALVVDGFGGRPTFVYDYPVDTSPLVRSHRSLPGTVEKWDLYIHGFEQATGYSELVDPVVQRERLVAQAALGERGDVEAMRLDEDFLTALEHGMPPSGGVGMGIDRLLMTLTGLGIRETVLFPLVRPGT